MINKYDNVKDTQLEIDLAELEIKDLQSLIRKHSKSATLAENRRQERISSLQCDYPNIEEAHEAFGYDAITEEEYYEIVKFFETREAMKLDLELIELHRNNLKKQLQKAKRNLNYHKVILQEIQERENKQNDNN